MKRLGGRGELYTERSLATSQYDALVAASRKRPRLDESLESAKNKVGGKNPS